MFEEILDRRVVLAQTAAIREALEAELTERPTRGGDAPPVEHADELRDALADAERRGREAEETDRAEAAEAAAENAVRGPGDDAPRLIDHVAYLPRDAALSAVQSMLDEYFDEGPGAAAVAVPEELPVRADTPPEEIPPVTGKRIGLADDTEERVRLGERFSMTDFRWAQSKLSEWFTKWNGKHTFRDGTPDPVTLGDEARVLMVGDWASGIPRAQKVGARMRVFVEQALGAGTDLHVIHLGDTYYSGWKREFDRRFLPNWPVWPGEEGKARSWTLNGNHDMYSGGHGLYELLDEDKRFAGHAGRTFFHLRNDHWDLLGLDTAYEDHRLAGGQPDWVRGVIEGSQRKSLLMSHHQPFSARNDNGGELRRDLAPVLEGGRGVHTWFWGHEHRHVHYAAHAGIANGRLLGHGGVPVHSFRFPSSPYKPPETFELRTLLPDTIEPWCRFGFAVLDFKGPSIDVRYVDELGDTYQPETIT